VQGEGIGGWESEFSEDRGTRHPGAEFLRHGSSYGVLLGIEESGKSLGEFCRKFAKEHVNRAVNHRLLR